MHREFAMEVCRIVILVRADGAVDVAAPMKEKALCYEILKSAKSVIERSPDQVFKNPWLGNGARIVIVMNMQGVVDVSAPLPNREFCYKMLRDAKLVIERFDDAEAPPMRPFPAALLDA
jgi:hypothetical protein